MRRLLSAVVRVGVGVAGLIVTAGPARAGTITTPNSNPFVVPADASGNPLPFTVQASGFTPGGPVYVEQCDGTPATAQGWSPTMNCDLGSSPAAAITDTSGVATFAANDPNHAFHPFKGVSPQGLFNCLSPNDPSPNNGLPDFRNCQIRVSSNNSTITADQAFLTIQLPDAVGTTTTTTSTTSTTIAGNFGVDDSGFLPPDAPKGPITKCEGGIAKAVAKLVAADLKCHAARAAAKLTDDVAENMCEVTALGKFTATKTAGCAACTTLATIGGTVESLFDSQNARIYCTATGTPFGGDDTGNISAVTAETKCQGGVASHVGKLVKTILKCHASRAVGKLDDSTEDPCESTAITKFATTKTVGCPGCIDLKALGAWVEQVTDTTINASVYCAS